MTTIIKKSTKIGFLSIFLILFIFNPLQATKRLNLLVEKSFDVKSGQLLSLKTDIGDVTFKTWGQDEVYIKIYGDSDAEKKMEFSFDQDERGVWIVGEKEGGKIFSWFSKIDLKYEIKVPRNFNLDVKTSGGDIVAQNNEGEMKFKTSGGDIYLKNSKGDLYAGTSGGDVTLSRFSGNADVSTSGGDIEIDAENGNVSASTSGGDIFLKASHGKVKAKTSGGDISLNYFGRNNGITLYTSGGDIDVKLPSDLNADVEVKTSGGDIKTNFSNNKMSKISKSKLIGKYNNGGPVFHCKTSGGDITIREN